MKVLVAGGRDFKNVDLLNDVLDKIHRQKSIDIIIHGAARGADSLAGEWARNRSIAEMPFPADWETYGKAAGVYRNDQMLIVGKPDLVVIFPGGKGTKDMKTRAKRGNYEVIEIMSNNFNWLC